MIRLKQVTRITLLFLEIEKKSASGRNCLVSRRARGVPVFFFLFFPSLSLTVPLWMLQGRLQNFYSRGNLKQQAHRGTSMTKEETRVRGCKTILRHFELNRDEIFIRARSITRYLKVGVPRPRLTVFVRIE